MAGRQAFVPAHADGENEQYNSYVGFGQSSMMDHENGRHGKRRVSANTPSEEAVADSILKE